MGARKYTREMLVDAARAAEDWDEAVRACGAVPTPGTRRHVRRRMAALGVDISHIRTVRGRHTERRLREAAAVSRSVSDVVRHLGLRPVGGQHAHISRRLAELGIDTSHFSPPRRGGRQRSAAELLTLRTPEEGRVPGRRLRRLLVARGVPDLCALCGVAPWWNGRPLRLEVDHLNGRWWDDRPGNLRLLCPNCHAVTDTWRGRNRGRA
ncbi:HNH endonuclease [Streptomyces zhihengii]|uniref:HNH endonuclease n=1 Tax=Streptomyces zhihengii TaxID=1818004 RepID=UPI0036A5CA6A